MFFILLFYFRKMFIGGLSWQTTPGKNFLLGLFQTFFKELKLFNIPFDKKKATNDIGMDSNRKGIWIEIKVFYFDYVGLSIRQNPKSTFFKCEKYLLTWICFSILKIIIWTVMDEYLKEDDCKLKLHQYGCENDLCIWEITYFKTEVSQYIHIRWYLSANDATLPTPLHNPPT